MRTLFLPPPVGRRLQLNFLDTIRPEFKPPGYAPRELVSDEAIGTLDAPDAMPAGAVYRAQSNGIIMQRVAHRRRW
ncbi:hypothetical protein E6C76_14095 [Pseudothauera nasutitermitis]|uniref:Uncharacterized protein n=1 Tax=Pseudothauera nasutitermitis TaxID=2565930 RepID=A0A4S4AUT9_9RHOO|nr:hypothetical protein [Pseudothauera nasutitermitis]THF63716.1 hypothetical protein E6C76_14095 [Pseudothauera nasutitermitis]